MAAIVAFGILVIFPWTPAAPLFIPSPITKTLTLLSGVYWIYFIVGALRVNRAALDAAYRTPALMTSGVYGKVRHPMYSAHLTLAWGLFLSSPTVRVLASVVWATLVLLLWVQLEELVLVQKFGDAYLRYRKSVPMLIPHRKNSYTKPPWPKLN